MAICESTPAMLGCPQMQIPPHTLAKKAHKPSTANKNLLDSTPPLSPAPERISALSQRQGPTLLLTRVTTRELDSQI